MDRVLGGQSQAHTLLHERDAGVHVRLCPLVARWSGGLTVTVGNEISTGRPGELTVECRVTAPPAAPRRRIAGCRCGEILADRANTTFEIAACLDAKPNEVAVAGLGSRSVLGEHHDWRCDCYSRVIVLAGRLAKQKSRPSI